MCKWAATSSGTRAGGGGQRRTTGGGAELAGGEPNGAPGLGFEHGESQFKEGKKGNSLRGL
jgi:hypothetical protein